MDEDTCMVDIAKFFLQFTVDESCGKCAPCRVGTRRLLEILEKITRRTREPWRIIDPSGRAVLRHQKTNALCASGTDSTESGTLHPCVTSETNTLPMSWTRDVRQVSVRNCMTVQDRSCDKCKGCTLMCT